MLVCDFNYTFSRWPPHPNTDGLDSNAKEFYSCLKDNFLYQHVVFPTRKDNILGLVLTDEPHVRTVPDETTCYVFDYARSDLCKIKTELAKQDWHVLMYLKWYANWFWVLGGVRVQNLTSIGF